MNMIQHIRQETPNVLIVGIGNEFRMDDGAGLAVARQLGSKELPGVSVLEDSGDCARLVELWKMAPSVILIDAMSSGIEPGTILKFDLLRDEIPARYFRNSLHAFGVIEAVRLARSLGTLPSRMKLYGVEGERFEPGVGLTPAVVQATHSILPRIIRESERLAAAHLHTCSS